MKKAVFLLAFLVISFCLAVCTPFNYFYDYDELTDSVIKVELINYRNEKKPKLLFDGLNRALPFDFNKMEIIEVLPKEKTEAFLKDLAEILIHFRHYHHDSPNGICVRLVYENGDFEVVTSSQGNFAARFDSEGNIKSSGIGSRGTSYLDNTINKHFQTQMPARG